MNRNCIKSFICAAILGVSAFTSCSDDDKEFKGVDVTNAELKAVLQQKGFTFDMEGKLVQDDKVLNTVTLDLSGCNLTDASGLDVFPKLAEVNLANNKFGFAFDFSVLPATITGVDLTGNEIYEYPGLVDVVTEENGDETVTTLRQLTKLYLPESAWHNCDEVLHFYSAASGVDLKMANANGQLAAYTTLREVPDENLRAYLQKNYPSMFDITNTDMINIANRMIDAVEAARNLTPISLQIPAGVGSVEGAQYIAMNPSYKGTITTFWSKTGCELKYYRVKSSHNALTMYNVSTAYINWTDAKNLYRIIISGNNGIEQVDFSMSGNFGQRGANIETVGLATSYLEIFSCPKLKTIAWPSVARYTNHIYLYNLPLLEEADLSQFSGMGRLALGGLPGLEKLAYFTPDGYYGTSMSGEKVLPFIVSTDIYARPETRTFLNAYHENCSNSYAWSSFLSSAGLTVVSPYEQYDWTKDYSE